MKLIGREYWIDIKQHFINLNSSHALYSDYLIKKNKTTSENHRFVTPVRELSKNLHLKFLNSSISLPETLQSIDDLVASLPIYTYAQINDFLLSDSFRKYRLLNLLTSKGPSVLLTYSAGGSIGSLYFIWRVS